MECTDVEIDRWDCIGVVGLGLELDTHFDHVHENASRLEEFGPKKLF